MRGRPDKRRPQPGGIGRGPLKIIAVDNSDNPEHRPPARRRSRRPPGPGELAAAEARCHLRRVRLVLIEGGRP